MSEPRFDAHPAIGVGPDRAVKIIRNFDGRVFAMSATEARDLAIRLKEAAMLADERRK